MDATHNERYERGWRRLAEIDGEAGQRVVDGLAEICPDLAHYIIEYSFGDIYSRPGLTDMEREIAVTAALTAMGSGEPQLAVHLNAALNVGCSITDLKEVILQMAAYAGFPRMMNGMNLLMTVTAERRARGIADPAGSPPTPPANEDRYERGADELRELDPLQVDRLHAAYDEFTPEMIAAILEFAYADIHGRDNLNKRLRQIATIAALTALGNAQPQLLFHIRGGLRIGLSEEEVKEVILLMSVYAGFPAAINAMNTLLQVVRGSSHEEGQYG
jgi:4-carboxymuconolactone decarboxylase